MLLLGLLCTPVTARADDWLALHPECAFDASVVTPGHMAMLYPRAGLPAVVGQGEPLVTRVRVPSGLTPPPGIQQDRALVGWSAELVGDGIPIAGRGEHRYPLRVVDVRPDGPSSLVYRATILVPRWAAPGTYALRMTAPGGGDAVAGSVRIVPPGRPVRIALARLPEDAGRPDETLQALGPALARMAVDVWVLPDHVALRGALGRAPVPEAGAPPTPAVLLLPSGPRGLPVVLRLGADALVLGECDGRFVTFADQLDGILAAEGRSPVRLGADPFPEPGTWRPWGDGSARPLPRGGARVVHERDHWTVATRPSAGVTELTVVLPDDDRPTAIDGAPASWWPATPVPGVVAVPSLAARLEVPEGATVTLRRGEPAELSLEITAEPDLVETGLPVALRAVPSRPVERVAWQLDEDRTAVGREVRHRWAPLGQHRVSALAIAGDGVAARATATVEVRTREVTGCDCQAAAPSSGAPSPEFWPLGALLVKTVRRRPRGNTAAARNRWESRRCEAPVRPSPACWSSRAAPGTSSRTPTSRTRPTTAGCSTSSSGTATPWRRGTSRAC